MNNQTDNLTEKIRQQFSTSPYPRIPIETSPKDKYESLYLHNLVTPYYLRNRQIISTEDKVILDAGCGTGYKSLILATANPGAKIVGIDLSSEALTLAKHRLEYHGINNAEFHQLSIEDLPDLNQEFDYINTDDVLYLLPDIAGALTAMKSVLKPDGIIRANLHSSLQRTQYYRVQSLFKAMGLMDENPEEIEINLAREIMESFKNDVILKASTWKPDRAKEDEWMLMNYLFVGDKGFTIPETFAFLSAANLEFISMLNWAQWDLLKLFKEPDNLPTFIAMSLPEISLEEQFKLFELLHPIHRLIDFWCGHPDQGNSYLPVEEWSNTDWEKAKVYLHPQIRHDQARQDLINCINNPKPFEISRYVPLATTEPWGIDISMASCLLPLWDGEQSMISLVERWLKLRPLDPITLEPVSWQAAFDELKAVLIKLESFLYVLIDHI